jgi:hypothetical protein
MEAPTEHRLYSRVLREVLWDEPSEETFKMLEVNGVVGDEAEAMFRSARKERVSSIRQEAFPRILKGTVTAGISSGVFALFWFGFGGITQRVFILCALGAAVGAWWLIDGVIDWAFAPGKKGSIAAND